VSSFIPTRVFLGALPNALANPLTLLANVDWALMNFMADWFPVESREKLLSNGREANAELAREAGLDREGCVVM